MTLLKRGNDRNRGQVSGCQGWEGEAVTTRAREAILWNVLDPACLGPTSWWCGDGALHKVNTVPSHHFLQLHGTRHGFQIKSFTKSRQKAQELSVLQGPLPESAGSLQGGPRQDALAVTMTVGAQEGPGSGGAHLVCAARRVSCLHIKVLRKDTEMSHSRK